MITTHVLDTARGRPAAGVPVVLEMQAANGQWQVAGKGITDFDGRIREFLLAEAAAPGAYRLIFDVAAYFQSHKEPAFYTEVIVSFRVEDSSQRYHVPLLLSPWSYTTYRGS